MKITLHSEYQNFTLDKKPKYIEWTTAETGLHCYVNQYVITTPEPNSIALLIEPRVLQPDNYRHIQEHYTDYKYVFTHDSYLLATVPNARKILFGGIWASDPQEKTKNISLISSQKQLCPLHIERLKLAYSLNRKIDCYGYNGHLVDTITAHAPYRFAVVIENYIDEDWFTEKICNCFANKTIPIYYGAINIGRYFNADGIIMAHPSEIPSLIDKLDPVEEYNKRLEAVEDNYKRVQKYAVFEDWFYNMYKDLLEAL